jgi:hypothetical protein
MRRRITMLAILAALAATPACMAASYSFDVLYTGGGNATLAPGSDNPIGVDLLPSDSFTWDIKAQSGGPWTVVTGGSFFLLMAFGVDEQGARFGDFTLTLSNNGVGVFSDTETNVETRFFHVGTNSITLSTGLVFEEMNLVYTLVSSSTTDTNGDPTGNPTDTTIDGLLPIFGAPEQAFGPNIVYGAVPEPKSLALLTVGACAAVAAVRRRRVAA